MEFTPYHGEVLTGRHGREVSAESVALKGAMILSADEGIPVKIDMSDISKNDRDRLLNRLRNMGAKMNPPISCHIGRAVEDGQPVIQATRVDRVTGEPLPRVSGDGAAGVPAPGENAAGDGGGRAARRGPRKSTARR